MRIHVRIDRAAASGAEGPLIERRLRSSLRRYSPRIRSATVEVSDTIGPNGSSRTACRIDIRLLPFGSVFVEDAGPDMYAAFDRAAERAARSTSRAIELARDSERDPSPPIAARHSSTLLDADE